MPAGQVKVVYTSDETEAARGTANLIRLYKPMDTEAKNLRKTCRSSGRAVILAMDDTSDAAKSTGKKRTCRHTLKRGKNGSGKSSYPVRSMGFCSKNMPWQLYRCVIKS